MVANLSRVTENACPAHSVPPVRTVTWPQVVQTLSVLLFTGWMLTQGFDWYLALLTAGGAVTVATSLSRVPRGIVHMARVLSQDAGQP